VTHLIRNFVVFMIFFLTAFTAAAEGAKVPLPNSGIKIPAPIKGNLIIYRVGFTQCSMFVSDEGMAKGTVQPSCVLLPTHEVPEKGFEFEILDVITTTGD
jgi:hypothetical protein